MSIWTKPIGTLEWSDVEAFYNLKLRENEVIEYKADWPEKAFAKWLCSFVNHKGGIIVLGIADDGEGKPKALCGADKTTLKPENVDAAAQDISPPILGTNLYECSDPIQMPGEPGKAALVVRIRPGNDIPYCDQDGRVYIRTDGSSTPMIDKDTKSRRVDIARQEDILRLIRRRREGEDLRDKIQNELMIRMRNKTSTPPQAYGFLLSVPNVLFDPKGGRSLEEFRHAMSDSIFSAQGRQFPVSSLYQYFHLGNGVAIDYPDWGEFNRNGAVCWRLASKELVNTVEADRVVNVLHVGQLMTALYIRLLFLSNLYKNMGLYNEIRFEVQIHGAQDMIGYVGNDAGVRHIAAMDEVRAYRIAESAFSSDVAVWSPDFVESPVKTLEALLPDLLFPTLVEPDVAMGFLKKWYGQELV